MITPEAHEEFEEWKLYTKAERALDDLQVINLMQADWDKYYDAILTIQSRKETIEEALSAMGLAIAENDKLVEYEEGDRGNDA